MCSAIRTVSTSQSLSSPSPKSPKSKPWIFPASGSMVGSGSGDGSGPTGGSGWISGVISRFRTGGAGLLGALGGTTSASSASPPVYAECCTVSYSKAVHSKAARTRARAAMKPSSMRRRGVGCFFMARGFIIPTPTLCHDLLIRGDHLEPFAVDVEDLDVFVGLQVAPQLGDVHVH